LTHLPALLALALLQLPVPATPGPTSPFHYRRAVHVAAPGQACAILDASTYAHAEPFLKDLRLSATDASGTHELPFVLTLSEAQAAETEPARVLHLAAHGRAVDFDLAMPLRPYTEVDLDLAGQDFRAIAVVSGARAPGSPTATPLGSFNLFDLTTQHLSRNTALHLQESSFPFLHITLTASSAVPRAFQATPQMVRGASVPPSREAQTLFIVAAQTSDLQQQHDAHGGQTVAHLHLPQRVPIERVSVTLAPGPHPNFSREIRVSSHTLSSIPAAPADSGDLVDGVIRQVKLHTGSRPIDDVELSIPATLGANLQQPAEVEVAINNGDDPPIPISSVQLEMRRRSLCFQAPAAQQLTLFYGDPDLPAPAYDLARTYTPSARSAVAQLGPEVPNPAWQPRPDVRPYTERNPHLLWIALLIAVCILALVAFRASKKHLHHLHR